MTKFQVGDRVKIRPERLFGMPEALYPDRVYTIASISLSTEGDKYIYNLPDDGEDWALYGYNITFDICCLCNPDKAFLPKCLDCMPRLCP